MKKLLIVPILVLAVTFTACSTAWVSTVDSILAAAAPALIDILQIVAIAKGVPMESSLAAKINADAATIKTLATDFSKTSTASGCTALTSAIQIYQQDQSLVLQVAQVSDQNTQTKITLLAGLVAGTVQAITAVIPACQMPASLAKAEPPLKLSRFVSSYNAILVTPTGNRAVDSITPKLKLHQHSKFVHYASAGLLK